MKKMVTYASLAFIALFAFSLDHFRGARAEPNHLMIPQSIRYEHVTIIDRLTKEAGKDGVTAAVAQRLLTAVKAHFAKEEEFVLPPLGLLDQIAAGEMPSDSVRKTAIEMAERTKAAEAELNQEEIRITSMMNELIQVATRASEPELVAFFTNVAVHSLNEGEILEPTTVMIGKYLELKAAQ